MLFCLCQLLAPVNGQDATLDEAWRRQVRDGAARSDLVVRGTVESVRSYVHLDGGHGYDVAVTEVLKGASTERVSARAGGWLYLVKFHPGEDVLLFLVASKSQVVSEQFALVETGENKPLAFRLEADAIVPVDQSLAPAWEGRSVTDVRNAIGE